MIVMPSAHAAELRQRLRPRLTLLLIRSAHIHIFPVGVERARNSVGRDPGAQDSHRGPDRFLRAEPTQAPAGRIVHQRQQTAVGAAILHPGMKTAIQLHQLAEMRHALPTPAMRTALPRPAPQARGHHPPSQRLMIDGHAVFTRQMLRRQRRPKALVDPPAVLLANQRQNAFAKSRRRPPI
jgi:hypothetical protein